jgi:hypothetical protein
MPRQPIGEDFIARMISDRALEPNAGTKTTALDRPQSNASNSDATSRVSSSSNWWNFSAISIRRVLGMAPAKPERPAPYMSLGNQARQQNSQ